ncbi:MAG: hypothetical protein JXR88_12105 [Clostridia bacterium]|nr:hypothetical protein [Clostridia bacterium]
MKKKNYTFGIILLAIGFMTLFNNLGFTHFNFALWKFWPFFLIGPGLAFELSYFNHNGPVGLLVPGGILLTYGLLFQFCTFFGYGHMAYLWPLFIGAVGIGLFQLYYFGTRPKPLLFVSFGFIGFTLISMFFALLNLKGNFALPIILIAVGGMMLLNKHKGESIISVEYDYEE